MRRPTPSLPVLLAALLLALPAASDVKARVNGKQITSEQVDEHLERSLGSDWARMSADKLAEARKSVLEQLIRTELIEQDVVSSGVKVTPGEVAAKIAEMRRHIKLRYAGKTTLEQVLRKNYSYMAFLARVVRGSIGLYKIIEQQTTDDKIKAYFAKHPKKFRKMWKASHIYFPTVDLQSRLPLPRHLIAKAKADALKVHGLVKADGSNFAQLAGEHSSCPSKKRGGDLGWFDDKRMVPGFVRQVQGMAKGQISGVFRTRLGYHIARLTERRSPTWREAKKPYIYTQQEEYMKKLLKAARIERLP